MSPVLEYASLTAKRLIRFACAPVTFATPYIVKRRFQVYGVGMGKTGTHSVVGLFRHYRSAHEPENDLLIPFLINHWDQLSQAQKAGYVRHRDRRLWLEVEASHLLLELTGTLVAEFPEAKFILTIRDVFSWLDSQFAHRLSHTVPSRWPQLSYYRARHHQFKYAPEDQVLADNGYRPLESYLSRWASHNHQILETVPKERLLILRTHELSHSAPALAAFLNIPQETLDQTQTHLFKATRRSQLPSQINQKFLAAKIDEHCGDLMQEFFPGLKSFEDSQHLQAGG